MRSRSSLTISNLAAKSKPRPMLRKDAVAYRRKYLSALARHQKWSAGDALDFQRDFQIYEELIARSGPGRKRKPFEARIIRSSIAARSCWIRRSSKKQE